MKRKKKSTPRKSKPTGRKGKERPAMHEVQLLQTRSLVREQFADANCVAGHARHATHVVSLAPPPKTKGKKRKKRGKKLIKTEKRAIGQNKLG